MAAGGPWTTTFGLLRRQHAGRVVHYMLSGALPTPGFTLRPLPSPPYRARFTVLQKLVGLCVSVCPLNQELTLHRQRPMRPPLLLLCALLLCAYGEWVNLCAKHLLLQRGRELLKAGVSCREQGNLLQSVRSPLLCCPLGLLLQCLQCHTPWPRARPSQGPEPNPNLAGHSRPTSTTRPAPLRLLCSRLAVPGGGS